MSAEESISIDERVRKLKNRPYKGGPVVYWMSRDQRAHDNWTLLYSIQMANKEDVPHCVVFCLAPEYGEAGVRQCGFMLKGLSELETELVSHGIEFVVLEGYPEIVLPSFLHSVGAGLLVTDFNPLRIEREWRSKLASEISIPFDEVDAHNVVPCWLASKHRILTHESFLLNSIPYIDFLNDFPPLEAPRKGWPKPHESIEWEGLRQRLKADMSVKEVDWIVPGEKAASKSLQEFIETRLAQYAEHSDDPTTPAQSDLSPYIHFGQISSQRAALEVVKSGASIDSKASFLRSIIIKKEHSDNFVFHTPQYDTIGAFPKWAKDSIDAHRSDDREHLYTRDQLESAQTHDQLWNASQIELLKAGKIHGSMRAYWAHMIMNWMKSPEEAFATAIYLNNRYSLDGRDPNVYTGISSVMGGLFDKPTLTKEVYGKVRNMTYTDARLRYDIKAYEERVKTL
ncbi:MAG TPA: deoxyribodipyrimidine photo-lyase [Methanomassiliicoccales archaeon]|nr:deoxyribodipyrimidine photo-lyase [Methanomassiliicoccales archaeon]